MDRWKRRGIWRFKITGKRIVIVRRAGFKRSRLTLKFLSAEGPETTIQVSARRKGPGIRPPPKG